MTIIRERQHVTETYYRREFLWKNDSGAGFSFDVDTDGNLLNMNPAAQENYNNCINGTYDVIDYGVQKHTHSYWDCAVGKCSCGEEVYLQGFTNTCDNCGADYNMSGQLLSPREQWGEETGEHWTECY